MNNSPSTPTATPSNMSSASLRSAKAIDGLLPASQPKAPTPSSPAPRQPRGIRHSEADRTPRGVKNNNPLNIRKGRSQWIGQAPRQTDPAFVCFQDLRYGYLAALRLIGVYMSSYHLYTPEKIINRWAPPSENHTSKYVSFVCSETGIGGQENLSPFDPRLKDLIRAMAIMENGKSWIDQSHDAAIEKAWQEYLSSQR